MKRGHMGAMQISRFAAAGAMAAAFLFAPSADAAPNGAAPRNIVIFVADGLRSHSVTPETAPALAAVRAEGVDFANSHSLYPTITTPNAAAIATGHLLGDTGDFGNTIYVGAPLPAPYGSSLAAIEEGGPTLRFKHTVRRQLSGRDPPARRRPGERLCGGRARQARPHRDPGCHLARRQGCDRAG